MSEDLAFIQQPVEFESEGSLLQGCLYTPDPPPNSTHSPGAVILCHGALEHRANWDEYARRLAGNGYAVLTFDFAGHGESAGLPGAVEMRVWAYNLRDAMNFLDRRGYLRFGLVGWNSGGSAALLAGAHDPRIQCVAALAAPVLMMPSLSDRVVFGGASFVSRLVRLVRKRPLTFSRLREIDAIEMAANPEVNQRYFQDPLIRQVHAAVPVGESLDSLWIDITRSLSHIKAPVLILHGAKDSRVPLKQSQRLYELLPGTKKLQIVENSGHALHLDDSRDEVFIHLVVWIKKYLPV